MSTPTAEYATEKGPETRQLLAPPPPGPLGYYGAYQPPVVIPQDRPRNARRRRLWHFLACTFLFVGAMHLFAKRGPRGSKVSSAFIVVICGHLMLKVQSRQWYCGRPAQQQVRDDMYPYAPSDCSESVNWTTDGAGLPDEYPYHARTSFTLPVGAKELAFIAQGAQQHGHFELSQTADAGSDEAVVEVHVSYKAQNALSDATVCRLHPAEDSWGLGIFVRLPGSLFCCFTLISCVPRRPVIRTTIAASGSTSTYASLLLTPTPRSRSRTSAPTSRNTHTMSGTSVTPRTSISSA